MMGGFGGFGMLLWIALIVLVVWWVVQATTQKGTVTRSQDSKTPRQVLDERLAKGEITIEQHRELRKTLE